MSKVVVACILHCDCLPYDPAGQSDVVFRRNVNTPFNLNCTLAPSVNATVVWYYNNIPLCVEEQLQQEGACFPSNVTTDSRGTLVFRSLSLEQAGWYTCRKVLDMYTEEMDFLLIVQGTYLIAGINVLQ